MSEDWQCPHCLAYIWRAHWAEHTSLDCQERPDSRQPTGNHCRRLMQHRISFKPTSSQISNTDETGEKQWIIHTR